MEVTGRISPQSIDFWKSTSNQRTGIPITIPNIVSHFYQVVPLAGLCDNVSMIFLGLQSHVWAGTGYPQYRMFICMIELTGYYVLAAATYKFCTYIPMSIASSKEYYWCEPSALRLWSLNEPFMFESWPVSPYWLRCIGPWSWYLNDLFLRAIAMHGNTSLSLGKVCLCIEFKWASLSLSHNYLSLLLKIKNGQSITSFELFESPQAQAQDCKLWIWPR